MLSFPVGKMDVASRLLGRYPYFMIRKAVVEQKIVDGGKEDN